jgi:hypothetical protein
MRKAHMQAVIDGLKKRVTDVEHERDEVLARLHAKADAHVKGLAKLSNDVNGLAEAVRSAAAPAAPEPAPAAKAPAALAADAPASAAEPAAKPVTPIAAKRAAKAAG